VQLAVSTRGDDSPARKYSRPMLAVVVLALVGLLISSLSLYEHFRTSKTSFCDIGESFNCDLVNRSTYSTLLGVPVALIGVLGYLLVLVLASVYRHQTETPFLLLVAALLGLGFALYLTYIEARVLMVWCILCLSSLAVVLAITVLSVVIVLKRESQFMSD
jgi:uncharacterized membrane protein